MQEEKKGLEEEVSENTENKSTENKSGENITEEKVEEIKEEVKLTCEEEKALLQQEIMEWKKEYAIKLADFENYKKRKDKELDEFKKYACESLILKQLENMDVLNMAIESAKSNHDIDSLLEGLNMLQKGMFDNLVQEGLTEIETENAKYDPYKHHAIQTINDPEKEDDIVVQVFKKGYKLKNKIIRPAMVVINKK
ncbi:nucleotide exchange factor GrpE [Oceanivirga salmonicida]|uniref:nucleotide exchange factor GrpE n=1 Tax=Oceanivirga salmonicida TaxID=1769291 RepID=UPI0009EBEB4C|nr:nucleotide exchange factor GrpE [Oceanivirga salmonicida]